MALRRTIEGRYTLSFPARRDHAAGSDFMSDRWMMRPVRRSSEQVLSALGNPRGVAEKNVNSEASGPGGPRREKLHPNSKSQLHRGRECVHTTDRRLGMKDKHDHDNPPHEDDVALLITAETAAALCGVSTRTWRRLEEDWRGAEADPAWPQDEALASGGLRALDRGRVSGAGGMGGAESGESWLEPSGTTSPHCVVHVSLRIRSTKWRTCIEKPSRRPIRAPVRR